MADSSSLPCWFAWLLLLLTAGCQGPAPAEPPTVIPLSEVVAVPEAPQLFEIEDPLDDEVAASLEQSVIPTKRRLLVLLTTTPVLLDLELLDAERPMAERWESTAAAICAAADADEDQRTTWPELIANVQIQPIEQASRRNREMVTAAYDVNNNETVEPAELIRFINRDHDGQGFLTVVDTATDAYDPNVSTFEWLDKNKNGRLDKTEVENAPARLRMRDADGDGRVWTSDFRPLTAAMPSMMQRRPRARKKTQVFVIGDRTNWDQLLYAMEATYAYGDELMVDDLPETFRKLDENGDGYIDAAELGALSQQLADATVQVEFATELGDRLFVKSCMASPFRAIRFRQTLWQINDGHEQLQLRVEDQLPAIEAAAGKSDEARIQVALTAIRLQVSLDDSSQALFAGFDTDGSGWLDQDECGSARQVLTNMDRNGDGQVQPSDLAAGKRLYVRRAPFQLANNPQIQPPKYESVTAPDAPNWFIQMDANRDGQVERIEFLGPAETFTQLDANNNGQLEVKELKPFDGS
jgi:Ca2+-binding EF-hand superfamily protein